MIQKVLIFVFIILVCVVQNRSKNVFLKGLESEPHHSLPLLTSANLSYSVVLGSRCLLECQVDNLGQFVVLWRKGDRILSVGKLLVRKDGKVRLREDNSLEVVEVSEADGGQYSCQLDVYGHTQSVQHNLTVLVPPHIHSWERTLEVTAGDDITIICEATGHPPPTIAWRKYETGANLASPHSDRIVITNITRTGGGLYVCTADNGVTEPVERTTRIQVRHPPEVLLEETWKPNGDEFEVFLSCNVVSFPKAKISWYKNGNVKLSTSDEILITENDPKYSLKIEKLRERNFGLFSCRASSSLGSSEATIELSGKPRSPIFNSEMREILVGVGEVNISWSCDSFYPVTQYYLYFRHYKLQTESEVKGWTRRVVVCDSGSTSSLTHHCWYSLHNLDNDTLYDVKLSANNLRGSSPSSNIHSFYVSTGRKSEQKPGKIGKTADRRQDSEISPMQVLSESKDLTSSSWKLSESSVLSNWVLVLALTYSSVIVS